MTINSQLPRTNAELFKMLQNKKFRAHFGETLFDTIYKDVEMDEDWSEIKDRHMDSLPSLYDGDEDGIWIGVTYANDEFGVHHDDATLISLTKEGFVPNIVGECFVLGLQVFYSYD